MKDALIAILKDTDISEGAAVQWADFCDEGNEYWISRGVTPGSLVLGIEYLDNGHLIHGTLQLQPPKIGILN